MSVPGSPLRGRDYRLLKVGGGVCVVARWGPKAKSSCSRD